MAIYAIGDIHGSIKALETLIKHQSFQEDDTIVFLGDYINKGSDTKATIDLLLQLQQKQQCIFLRGNHELMMLAARNDFEKFMEWYHMGGKTCLASYGISPNASWDHKIPDTHWNFIENTLAFHQINDTVFVHAALEKNKALHQQDPHHLFWKKIDQQLEAYDESLRVVCGHTAQKTGEILHLGHTICIDTYAYGGKWLSCLNLDTLDFIQTAETGLFQHGSLAYAYAETV